MSSSLGKAFRITSLGESHGPMVGIVIDGCPAGLALNESDIQPELDRRKPGISPISTPRQEEDRVVILSGVFNGHTSGASICLAIWNKDADSTHYEKIKDTPRPGHADYTAYVKYGGWADLRGGGRFSGRITAGFVMAGAVARKLLATLGIEVLAHTTAIGSIKAKSLDVASIKKQVNQNKVHCADPQAAIKMIRAIETAQKDGDSLGGIIEVMAMGVPGGWGEPVFDTMDGELARAFFAIPAVKGVEFGAGFNAAYLKGSQNNDPYIIQDGKVVTATNNAGGILGGITSGMPLVARLAIKPTPSIKREQRTVNLKDMSETGIRIEGRHDSCIVPRAVVVAEAMTCIVLCDMALRAGALPGVMK
jgi:chorismate synthase